MNLEYFSWKIKVQIGLNDDDKIQYKIEAEEPASNNRLTVAWELGIFLELLKYLRILNEQLIMC